MVPMGVFTASLAPGYGGVVGGTQVLARALAHQALVVQAVRQQRGGKLKPYHLYYDSPPNYYCVNGVINGTAGNCECNATQGTQIILFEGHPVWTGNQATMALMVILLSCA